MGVEIQPHYLTRTADGRYILDLTQIGFEPWQPALVLPGWEGSTAEYRRDPFGRVHLRGAVGPPGGGFPAGPGPAIALPYQGFNGQWVVPGPGYLTVATLQGAGTIFINDAVNPFEVVDLDVISFSTT